MLYCNSLTFKDCMGAQGFGDIRELFPISYRFGITIRYKGIDFKIINIGLFLLHIN